MDIVIINLHNRVGADIIRPRSLYKFIDAHFVGCGETYCPAATLFDFLVDLLYFF